MSAIQGLLMRGPLYTPSWTSFIQKPPRGEKGGKKKKNKQIRVFLLGGGGGVVVGGGRLTDPEWAWLIGLLWDWPTVGCGQGQACGMGRLVSTELVSASELDRAPPATSRRMIVSRFREQKNPQTYMDPEVRARQRSTHSSHWLNSISL